MSAAIDTLEHMFEHEGMPAASSTLRARADFDELVFSGGFDGPGDEFDDFPVQGTAALAPQPTPPRRAPDAADRLESLGAADRVAELQNRIRSMQATKLDSKALPTLPALTQVLPGGLHEGATYTVEGSTALLMAMLAGPSAAGSWVAVVGLPDFGAEAAARFGIDLDRLVLVPHPGDHWLTVTAAVADVVTVVVVRAAGRVSPGVLNRLEARLRERGAVLIVQGAWPHSDARLSVSSSAWGGLGLGHGNLAARQVTVTALAKNAAGRPRSARLWLPDADARIRTVDPAESLEVVAPFDAATELARLERATDVSGDLDPAELPFEPTHPFEPRPRPLPPRPDHERDGGAQPLRLLDPVSLLEPVTERGEPIEWMHLETERDRGAAAEPGVTHDDRRRDDRHRDDRHRDERHHDERRRDEGGPVREAARRGIRYRGVGDPVDDRLLAIERRPETERAEEERMRRAAEQREARAAAERAGTGAATPAATDRHKQRRGFDAKQERALRAFAAAQEAAQKLGRTTPATVPATDRATVPPTDRRAG